MLDLRRLRMLHQLNDRGTIAAVADALSLTPSAVSQQLAVLEREIGVTLLEPAGRGVRLTDAAVRLVRHADALLARADLAEAELAGGEVGGRARIATFQSAGRCLAVPAVAMLARDTPGLRCELIEAEPEHSLPALARGDLDVVLGDEWEEQPLPRPVGVDREDLYVDLVRLVVPADHPTAQLETVPLAEVAHEPWAVGHHGSPWEQMLLRTCRALGGFEPDIRHRTNDAVMTLEIVARGQAVTLLPELVGPERHPGVAVKPTAEGEVRRRIVAATRTADAERASVQAVLAAIRAAAEELDRS